MGYSRTWAIDFFDLKIHTNDKTIILMADNFLDFPKKITGGLPLIKVVYHIDVQKKIEFSPSGIPLELVSAVDGGAIFLSLSVGKAFVAVDFKKGCVFAVVERLKEIKLEPLTDFLFFQSLRQIALRQGLFALHASIVQKGQKLFIITGPQNAGKSTMAASLMRLGYKILADDDCFFSVSDKQIKLYPFPTKMGFKAAGTSRFLEFDKFLVQGYVYGQKKRFSLKHLYVRPKPFYKEPVILFPKHISRKQIKVKAIPEIKVLERMIKGNLPLRWKKEMPEMYFESFLAIRSLVGISHSYELSYHDAALNQLSKVDIIK